MNVTSAHLPQLSLIFHCTVPSIWAVVIPPQILCQ